MKHSLFFDGVDICDYNAYIIAQDVFNAPEKEYEEINIPGRNGTLFIDREKYKNITVSYAAVMLDGFQSSANRLRNFLASRTGYKRLEDTYHPDEYYLACYRGETQIKTTSRFDVGKFILNFSRKPQRFLKSGENAIILNDSAIIANPELTTAKPLIRVYGSGTIDVGYTSFTVDKSEHEYVDIDSEIEDIYCGTANCNSLVTLTDFPVLGAGETQVNIGEGITRVEITPKWWRL